MRGRKLCGSCGQPMLRRGQVRKDPGDYRHARGCPEDDSHGAIEYRVRQRQRDLRRVARNLTMAQQRASGVFPALLLAVADDVDALLARAAHLRAALEHYDPGTSL